VKVIEHVIRCGSEFDGKKEWRASLGYEEGKKLFSSKGTSWYSIPLDCWLYQHNECAQGYWWTMNDGLAQSFIEKHSCQVEVI